MGLLARLRDTFWLERGTTGIQPYSWGQYMQALSFMFNGITYPFMPSFTYDDRQEEPVPTFEGYVQGAYKSNGVVFACMTARLLLFSEARFQYRRRENGRPGDYFGTQALEPLERPWQNATTGDLLARMIQDVDLAGNFYAYRLRNGIQRMRPDWITIVLGSDLDSEHPALAADAEVLGYIYKPPQTQEPLVLLPEQVCHFAPIPDPVARFRGMSWLTPVIRDIMGDNASSQHKVRYFERGATPNLAVVLDPSVVGEAFTGFVEAFKEAHGPLVDAYRTIFLGGGASITPVGSNMEQTQFKEIQGAGETRICAAARVPPIIVGVSEGLQSATYSNYGQARRAFADLTMRPLWRNAAGSLSSIIEVPPGAELWYDDRDIPFLQEDVEDAAKIVSLQAQAIRTLSDGGYQPDSVVSAVVANDLRLLEHTGMLPVQVRPPGEGEPSSNGAVQIPAEAE